MKLLFQTEICSIFIINMFVKEQNDAKAWTYFLFLSSPTAKPLE